MMRAFKGESLPSEDVVEVQGRQCPVLVARDRAVCAALCRLLGHLPSEGQSGAVNCVQREPGWGSGAWVELPSTSSSLKP